jgi:hypothetical protein
MGRSFGVLNLVAFALFAPAGFFALTGMPLPIHPDSVPFVKASLENGWC